MGVGGGEGERGGEAIAVV